LIDRNVDRNTGR